MTRELPDVQNETDYRGIPLDRVGIADLFYPLTILQKDRGTQPVTAHVDLQVELHEHQRGAHLSNLVETLELYRERPLSTNVLPDLLREVRTHQNERGRQARNAYVRIGFVYFAAKPAPASNHLSLASYRCGFEATLEQPALKGIMAAAPVATVCPCSLKMAELGAHSQRAEVLVHLWQDIEDRRTLWLEDIIAIAESSGSSDAHSILKRLDEKAVTEHMYRNPRFAEDVVREVVVRLRREYPSLKYKVACRSLESVHAHNVYAETCGIALQA